MLCVRAASAMAAVRRRSARPPHAAASVMPLASWAAASWTAASGVIRFDVPATDAGGGRLGHRLGAGISAAGRTEDAHLEQFVRRQGLVKGRFKAMQLGLSQGAARSREPGQTAGERPDDAAASHYRLFVADSVQRVAVGAFRANLHLAAVLTHPRGRTVE